MAGEGGVVRHPISGGWGLEFFRDLQDGKHYTANVTLNGDVVFTFTR